MSRRVDLGAWARLPAIVASALWQTWRRPQRRPVMAGLAVAPVFLVLALALPGESTRARVQAASPAPGQPPRASAPPRAAPPAGQASATDFTRRNPFKIKPNRTPDVPPAPTLPPAPPPIPPPPPRPPTVDLTAKLRLLGTFAMGGERWAAIVVVATNKEDVYKEGDTPLPNSRVIKIEPRKVHLLVENQSGVIEIDYSDWLGSKKTVTAGGAPPPAYSAPPPETLPAAPMPPPVQAPADGQPRRLARSEVDGYLDNLNTLLTQVNIQPVFQAGQPAGFRLTDIQKGTILDQIGVTDGDTLRFVNGQRIDSVQSAFQLYNILKESTNVEITVIRNTRPVTLRYLIY